MSRARRQPHRTVCRWTTTAPHPTRYVRDQLLPVLQRLGLAADTIDDVVLAASELAANAVEHAAGPYELRLRSTPSGHVLECHDRSPTLPPVDLRLPAVPLRPLPDRAERLDHLALLLTERGRGLAMVNHLFDGTLSARRTPLGKTVFFAFPAGVPSPSAISDGAAPAT